MNKNRNLFSYVIFTIKKENLWWDGEFYQVKKNFEQTLFWAPIPGLNFTVLIFILIVLFYHVCTDTFRAKTG